MELQQQSQEQEVKRVRHRGQNRVSLHVSPLIMEGVSGVILGQEGTTSGETILHLQVIRMADCKSHRLIGYLPRVHVIIVNVTIYMQVPMCTYIKLLVYSC